MQPLALAESGGANGRNNRRKMLCLCRRLTGAARETVKASISSIYFSWSAPGAEPQAQPGIEAQSAEIACALGLREPDPQTAGGCTILEKA